MKEIDIPHLEALALGAAILGSGGGGAPSYNLLITKRMIEERGPIPLKQISELTEDELVVPLAFMGAPLVALEKIPSGREPAAVIDELERLIGRRPTYLMPAEIGGANAFTPLWAALILKIPVLDGDLIGRAFPELQMSTCTLAGHPPNPAVLSDALGNVVVINSNDPFTVERIARQVTVAMGSRACVALYAMDAHQARVCVVPGTITQAIAIGTTLLEARKRKENPALAIAREHDGRVLATGMIADVNHSVSGGFLKGMATIVNSDHEKIFLHYQNEYLIAQCENEILASTPDILMLVEQEKGTPITSATLQYGQRVVLLAFPAPQVWTTPSALELVGPKVFGYEKES